MKVREFDKILKILENGTFVGDKLSIHGEGHLVTEKRDGSTHFRDKQIILLAAALKKNPKITKLDLSNNKIGDEGAINLAGVKSIETLDLSYNEIGSLGVKALAESNVKVLLLRNNPLDMVAEVVFGKEHVRPQFMAMTEAFIKNKSLVELNLIHCGIPDEMTLLIRQNAKIKSLYLDDMFFEIFDNKMTEKISNIQLDDEDSIMSSSSSILSSSNSSSSSYDSNVLQITGISNETGSDFC